VIPELKKLVRPNYKKDSDEINLKETSYQSLEWIKWEKVLVYEPSNKSNSMESFLINQ
jgi:hypothetical protein